MTNNEVYVSVDIETDGPIPAVNSMLSLGAAAFARAGEDLPLRLNAVFNVNLLPVDGTEPDRSTAEWWATQPEAYAEATRDPHEPRAAMHSFVRWVDSLPGRPVFVAYPAGFDFTFVYWYMMRFVGRSPFSFSAIDVKTLAMAALGGEYRHSNKRNWPAQWKRNAGAHAHVAVEDAVEQGWEFVEILNHLRAS